MIYDKRFAIFLLVICSMSCSTKEVVDTNIQKPNIILIMTDDQGYGDLSIHGNPYLKTPNLDKLAQESVRFSNFHVATTCAPTRAGLMTGVHCNRTGTWHTVGGRSFLSTRFPTIAEQLNSLDYSTGIFGKWHLGDNYPFRPQDRGFDEVLVHGGGGVGQTPDYWNNDYFDDTYFHNGKPQKYNGYCTDVWFQEAMTFIKDSDNNDEPFFCYITTNAPHGPHHAPQAYIDPYLDNDDIVNPNFFGQIANVDRNIGKLNQMLATEGLLENTIIIFLTDNGTAAGASIDKDKHVTKGYNSGMRGKKVDEYEGGHRVPLFIRCPEGMDIQKATYNDLITYTDIVPTLLDMVGHPSHTQSRYDGQSILPLLTTGKQVNLKERIVIVDTQREEHIEKWKRASVMKGDWRLVNNKELYNIATDPGQKENIIDQHKDLSTSLSNHYESWWDGLQADINQENYIIIGNEAENPSLLTSHDYHSNQLPPWHQNHIRSARIANGEWRIDVQHTGHYKIKLYRWPPKSGKHLDDTMPVGQDVDGGDPFKAGVSINPISAQVSIQDHNVTITEHQTTHYEIELQLERGIANLNTTLVDTDGIERGAYYVEIELI